MGSFKKRLNVNKIKWYITFFFIAMLTVAMVFAFVKIDKQEKTKTLCSSSFTYSIGLLDDKEGDYMNRYIDNKHNCTYAGGQFIILSSIFAAILSQEIESLEDLELLAAFLIAVADELALAIIARSQCESKYNEEENQIVEIVADKEGNKTSC